MELLSWRVSSRSWRLGGSPLRPASGAGGFSTSRRSGLGVLRRYPSRHPLVFRPRFPSCVTRKPRLCRWVVAPSQGHPVCSIAINVQPPRPAKTRMYTPNSSIHRQRSSNAVRIAIQRSAIVLSLAGLGASIVAACGSSDSSAGGTNGDDGGSGNTSGSGGGNGSGGNGSGGGNSSGNASGSGGRSSGGSNSGGNSGGSGGSGSSGSNSGSGSGSGGSNGSGSSSGSGSGSGGNSSGSTSGGSSSGSKDGGGNSSGADATVDGGAVCTNTDMTKINIDASGWICNNQWGIQGA